MPKSSTRKSAAPSKSAGAAPARNTDSGPGKLGPAVDTASAKAGELNDLAAAFPHNPTKAAEHGFANGVQPQAGATAQPPSRLATGSALSEETPTPR